MAKVCARKLNDGTQHMIGLITRRLQILSRIEGGVQPHACDDAVKYDSNERDVLYIYDGVQYLSAGSWWLLVDLLLPT